MESPAAVNHQSGTARRQPAASVCVEADARRGSSVALSADRTRLTARDAAPTRPSRRKNFCGHSCRWVGESESHRALAAMRERQRLRSEAEALPGDSALGYQPDRSISTSLKNPCTPPGTCQRLAPLWAASCFLGRSRGQAGWRRLTAWIRRCPAWIR